MSGVAFVISPCCACGRTFAYNPHKVPSITLNGRREPVCQVCMAVVNQKREKSGLPPHAIMDGAYEPIPESEL